MYVFFSPALSEFCKLWLCFQKRLNPPKKHTERQHPCKTIGAMSDGSRRLTPPVDLILKRRLQNELHKEGQGRRESKDKREAVSRNKLTNYNSADTWITEIDAE